MNKLVVISDIFSNETFGLVIYGDGETKAFPIADGSGDWADWCNQKNLSISEIREELGVHLQAEFARPLVDAEISNVGNILSADQFAEFKQLVSEPSIELVDAVAGHGRRFQAKAFTPSENSPSSVSVSLKAIKPQNRQSAINYKALSYRSESTFAQVGFEVKRARALWDPNLGPSGGWRCPTGTPYGGYITDRFGRGCGGGALRRVGRALVSAGRGIDKLGARRDARRLERVAARAQRGENMRERVGEAARRGVARVSNALERGAQRLVGEYQPRDYDPRTGRMGRRRVDAPNIDLNRRAEINSRLIEIADELNDIVDRPDSPEINRRRRELEAENRRLRRERDGFAPVRVARVEPVQRRRRVVAPTAQRQPRQQGPRPKKKPVAERERDGVMERVARRLVGDYQPGEYKPGDKKRIKNRRNRYADASDRELARALRLNGRDKARRGEGRDVEARRRQERLEVLQEMVNRGLPIPEEYKREVKMYRLKPQRRKRGGGLNRQGRAAVALERAAQRVVGGERVAPARPRKREFPNQGMPEPRYVPAKPKRQPAKPKPVDANKPKAPVDKRKNVADYSDDELIGLLKNVRRGGGDSRLPFKVEEISDGDLRRLEEIVSENRDDIFNDRRVDGGPWEMHPGAQLIYQEFNRREDNNLWKDRKPPASVRSRVRSARLERSSGTPIRRPQPKRQRGALIDAANLDPDQGRRLRDAAAIEKVALDANWRKRLELQPGEPITAAKIREYIKKRENNKPGAYIGVLKANANDWDVLNEFEQAIANRPAGANLRADHIDILNQVGPKRRQQFIERMNKRSSRPQRVPSARSLDMPASRRSQIPESPIDSARSDRPDARRLTGRAIDEARAKPGYLQALTNSDNIRADGKAGRDLTDILQINNPRALEQVDELIGQLNQDLAKRRQALLENSANRDVAVANYDAALARVMRAETAKRAFADPEFARRRNARVWQKLRENVSSPVEKPIEADEVVGVAQSIIDIGGSMPDSRSRRNVRNRFPNNGLPERAFWRDEDRFNTRDRIEHDRRFGRYYDADGVINARGRLVNDQLQAERPQVPEPSAPKPKASTRKPRPKPAPKPAPLKPNDIPPAPDEPVDLSESPNAIPALVPGPPKKRNKRLPVLGSDGTPDNPMPNIEQKKRAPIKDVAEAEKWLDDGKPLSEVPREFWWEAVQRHARGNSPKKQFKQVAKNGGNIGETRIFLALDDNGNPTGEGFLLKRDPGQPGNNVTEAAGFMTMQAFGLNIDAGGFDGGQESPNDIPAAIVPFAWNRAPDGELLVPGDVGYDFGSETPNFTPGQFDDLTDKAVGERLAATLFSYIVQVGDRHDQNQMGATIDGKPMVMPIDLGWAGRNGVYMPDVLEYGAFAMWADGGLWDDIRTVLSDLEFVPSEYQAMVEKLTGVYDGMVSRGQALIKQGKTAYTQRLLDGLSPEQRANPNITATVKNRASKLFDIIQTTVGQMEDQREDFFRKVFFIK